MSRWGCIGLGAGTLLGVVLLILLVSAIRPEMPMPSATAQPAAAVSNLTLFLSEQSVSRFASQALSKPVAINFEPGGQMILTTAVNIAGLEPIAEAGLSLQLQGSTVISQLHWLQVGFLRLPARWLPQEIVEMGTQVGPRMAAQLPPQFILVGLTTTTDGLNLQLDLTQ